MHNTGDKGCCRKCPATEPSNAAHKRGGGGGGGGLHSKQADGGEWPVRARQYAVCFLMYVCRPAGIQQYALAHPRKCTVAVGNDSRPQQ